MTTCYLWTRPLTQSHGQPIASSPVLYCGHSTQYSHLVLPCGFFLLSIFFPRLISAAADWMSTTHGVALCEFRMRLKCAAHGSLEMQDQKKSPKSHHCTTLSCYIFATKAHNDNRKKLVQSQHLQMSPHWPHNMVNFDPLAAEIGPVVRGTHLISTGYACWQRYCTALQ